MKERQSTLSKPRCLNNLSHTTTVNMGDQTQVAVVRSTVVLGHLRLQSLLIFFLHLVFSRRTYFSGGSKKTDPMCIVGNTGARLVRHPHILTNIQKTSENQNLLSLKRLKEI